MQFGGEYCIILYRIQVAAVAGVRATSAAKFASQENTVADGDRDTKRKNVLAPAQSENLKLLPKGLNQSDIYVSR